MRETNFIQQNREKWQEFERLLDGESKDAEKLNELFVQVTDDLSFSRTFYPNRSVRVYLNGLAQRAFSLIYKNRRGQRNRFMHFWMEELPQLVWEARREFALSFGVFVLSMLIGALSCAMDGEFANVILGDSYVSMTKANISNGDPMAVYKDQGQLSMSVGITLNNLVVAFLTFAMGAFFSIGSIIILVRNGVMVGVFQYFFIEQGLFWESFLTIWIHGTLEISAIIIAGAAGLTLGKGLVFPGTYRRIQAFQRSARRGLKIMVGIAPIIIMAGFIEGFLTRYTETPDVVRGAFIAVCFFFVFFYFVWYPYSKARAGFTSPLRDAHIPADSELEVNLEVVKSNGDIFSDAFTLAKKYAGPLLGGAGLIGLAYAAAVFPLAGVPPADLFLFPRKLISVFDTLPAFFVNEQLPYLPIVGIGLFIAIFAVAFRVFDKASDSQRHFEAMDVLRLLPAATALYFIFFANDWYSFFLLLFLGQLAVLWAYIGYRERIHAAMAFSRLFQLLGDKYGRSVGLSLLMLLVSILFFSITDSSLLWLYLEVVTWVVHLPEAAMAQFSAVFLTVLHIFMFGFLFMLYVMGCGLFYHSQLEIQEAPALLQKIQSIGTSRSIRGLEKE